MNKNPSGQPGILFLMFEEALRPTRARFTHFWSAATMVLPTPYMTNLDYSNSSRNYVENHSKDIAKVITPA